MEIVLNFTVYFGWLTFSRMLNAPSLCMVEEKSVVWILVTQQSVSLEYMS